MLRNRLLITAACLLGAAYGVALQHEARARWAHDPNERQTVCLGDVCMLLSPADAELIATAHAGEAGRAWEPGLIGTIQVADGGTVTNVDTGYLNGLAPNQAFGLHTLMKLTVQCDQAAYVLTEVYGVDAGNGIRVAQYEKIGTSINSVGRTATKMDGGSYTGGLVSVAPVAGLAAGSLLNCKVWRRVGNE